MKPEVRTALTAVFLSGAVMSLHAFDLRVDSLGFWLLNIALALVGLGAGALAAGGIVLKMSSGVLGLALGLMIFSNVMTSRDPHNNLLPLALAINFVVGVISLGLGTVAGALLRRQQPARPETS